MSGALHWPLRRYFTVITGCYCAGFPADVRWTGEEDLVNDPKLLSLKDDYLKIREGSLRNIAFNANATGGGVIKKNAENFGSYNCLLRSQATFE